MGSRSKTSALAIEDITRIDKKTTARIFPLFMAHIPFLSF
jgi:hypothetical protein